MFDEDVFGISMIVGSFIIYCIIVYLKFYKIIKRYKLLKRKIKWLLNLNNIKL